MASNDTAVSLICVKGTGVKFREVVLSNFFNKQEKCGYFVITFFI